METKLPLRRLRPRGLHPESDPGFAGHRRSPLRCPWHGMDRPDGVHPRHPGGGDCLIQPDGPGAARLRYRDIAISRLGKARSAPSMVSSQRISGTSAGIFPIPGTNPAGQRSLRDGTFGFSSRALDMLRSRNPPSVSGVWNAPPKDPFTSSFHIRL
jgi:hypothetical protein